MEVEEMYIVRSQAKVVGLDRASLQGPAVPARLSSNLISHSDAPSSKRSLDPSTGLGRDSRNW